MRKVNLLNNPVIYSTPDSDDFSTAELALIDDSYLGNAQKPNAYTATVKDDYESRRVFFNDPPDIATVMKAGFGLFLSNEGNLKGNMMFTCVASMNLIVETTPLFTAYALFGRTSASTITSSKSAADNALVNWAILPSSLQLEDNTLNLSVNTNVIAEAQTADEVFCFAVFLSNGTAGAVSLIGGLHMTFIKDLMGIKVARADFLG